MIEHLWTVLCRGTAIDRDTNSLSVFDIVEQFAVLPAGHQPHPQMVPMFFEIVSVWGREQPDQPCKQFAMVELVKPNGDAVELAQYDVDLTEHERSRIRGRFAGFPSNTAGRHLIRVSRRQAADAPWEVVGRVPLLIQLPPPQNDPNAQAE